MIITDLVIACIWLVSRCELQFFLDVFGVHGTLVNLGHWYVALFETYSQVRIGLYLHV